MAGIILPSGLTPGKLDAARREFAGVVGEQNLFFDALDRDSYRDKFAIDDAGHKPLGAIAPISAEEVQQVVKIAQRLKTPLWPISRTSSALAGAIAPSGR